MTTYNFVFLSFVLLAPNLCFGDQPKPGTSLRLSPQFVIYQVFKQGDERKQVDLNREESKYPLSKALGVYDFKLMADTAYQNTQAEALGGFNNEEDQTWNYGLGLSKMLPTGTLLKLEYDRVQQRSVLSSFNRNVRPSNQTQDVGTLSIEQFLLGNAFGLTDRYRVKIAKSDYGSAELKRQEDYEDLALKSLRLYWDALIAKEQLRMSLAAREKYQRLVNTIRRKRQFGATNPAALPSAQAELAQQDMLVKNASVAYLESLDLLFLQMNLKKPDNVAFSEQEKLPLPPADLAYDLNGLRKVRIAKDRLKAAKLAQDLTGYATLPDLKLLASAASTGVEEKDGAAFSEMLGQTKPTYFVGLQLSMRLDSELVDGEVENVNLKYKMARLRLEMTSKQMAKDIQTHRRQVQALYQVAQSSTEAEKLRQTVVREEDRRFRQGRIDINQLVIAYNSLFAAQAAKAESIGNYNFALNALAAAQDQLRSSN